MFKSKFKFTNPKLITLNFNINKCLKKTNASEIDLDTSIETNINEINENEAIVELNIEIGESSDSVPFYINLVIGAKFKLDAPIERTNFDTLLKVNAPSLLLSYARPIIASVTNSAGIKPINLPFINFTNQPQKDTN